jgi:hypothetical protein
MCIGVIATVSKGAMFAVLLREPRGHDDALVSDDHSRNVTSS